MLRRLSRRVQPRQGARQLEQGAPAKAEHPAGARKLSFLAASKVGAEEIAAEAFRNVCCFRPVRVAWLEQFVEGLELGVEASDTRLFRFKGPIVVEGYAFEKGVTGVLLEEDAESEQLTLWVAGIGKVLVEKDLVEYKPRVFWDLEDLREYVVAHNAEGVCFAEALDASCLGKPFEGAYCTVARNTTLRAILDALPAGVEHVWLEIFGVNQDMLARAKHAPEIQDMLCTRIPEALQRFEKHLLVLEDPRALMGQPWSLWELYLAARDGVATTAVVLGRGGGGAGGSASADLSIDISKAAEHLSSPVFNKVIEAELDSQRLICEDINERIRAHILGAIASTYSDEGSSFGEVRSAACSSVASFRSRRS